MYNCTSVPLLTADHNYYKLNVLDITEHSESNLKSEKKRSSSNKVLLSNFKSPRLALFAKRCARMATCMINLCPDDKLFCWPVFKEEIDRLASEGRGDALVATLAEVNKEPEMRDQLLHFVSQPLLSSLCYDDDVLSKR